MELDLSNPRSNECFEIAGSEISFWASKGNLDGVYVRFDSPDNEPIPVGVFSRISIGFDRFYLSHPAKKKTRLNFGYMSALDEMRYCRDCEFCEEDWLTSLSGHGLYRFSYCERLVHDLKVVEPEVKRRCGYFKKRAAGRKSKGDI